VRNIWGSMGVMWRFSLHTGWKFRKGKKMGIEIKEIKNKIK